MVLARDGLVPPGKTRRSPSAVALAIVTLSDTTFASAGMPHWFAMMKDREPCAVSDGAPYAPAAPRVSRMRQGVNVKKFVATGGPGPVPEHDAEPGTPPSRFWFCRYMPQGGAAAGLVVQT